MIFENNDPRVEVPQKDLTSVVLQRANELGKKPALIDGVSGRTLSYSELRQQINHLATGLHQKGFRKGDVCAVFCPGHAFTAAWTENRENRRIWGNSATAAHR